MRIAVLMGGISSERDISLMSGFEVSKGLQKAGHEVLMMDLKDRSVMSLPSSPSFTSSSNLSNYRTDNLLLLPVSLERLKEELRKRKIELVFIALHGRLGEDGTIQGLLEVLGIPYTGSGVLASALAMDKTMAKKIFLAESILTAKFIVLDRDNSTDIGLKRITNTIKGEISFPVVVKPACQGSTIGVSIARKEENLKQAINLAFSYDDKVLVEEYIEGKEVTVGILGSRDPVALPPIELVFKSPAGLYDYQAKYVKDLSQHIIPPRTSARTRQIICQTALRAHKALGCRGFSRVDLILAKDDKPFVLEVNTIPGLTEMSLVPEAAKAAGIEFPELVDRIVKLVLEDISL